MCHGRTGVFEAYLVPFVDQLMRSCDELQAVDMVELLGVSMLSSEAKQQATHLRGHFIAEQPPCTSRRHGPRINILRITPDKITKRALVRDLLRASYDANLV